MRDRLVEAAERAVAADGLADLRARALAEAAGCSVGAIYTAFTDLDALILEVNGRTLAALDAALTLPPAQPGEALQNLAAAYLTFAAAERRRWDALFSHRLPPGRALPAWYAAQQDRAFSNVEAPLEALVPSLPAADRALLARSLFAAVHGVVALGLDEKVATLPLPQLHAQLRLVVTALAAGLSAGQ